MANVTLPSGTSIALPTFATTADILASLQNAIKALNSLMTNFNGGGVIETYLEGVSLGLGSDGSTYPGMTVPGAYELLTQVQNAAYALTATGTALDLKAADVGVLRKPATFANGPGLFTIISPSPTTTVIPKGTLVAAEPADPTALPILYTTDVVTSIPPNQTQSGTLTATAVASGASGNNVAGTVNRVISGASNVTFVNTASMSGGADTEQDDSPNGGLRARVLSAIADASQCTISAIEFDARSYPGVTDAVLVENTADDGTVLKGRGQLYIDDGTGDLGNAQNANHAIIATVQAAFDTGLYRAASTQVHVVGSVLLPLTISLTAEMNQTYVTQTSSVAAVTLAIQIALFNYSRTIGIGKPVFLSEIARYVNEIKGVSNVPLASILINGANADLRPTTVQVPRCATTASVTVAASIVTY